MQSIWKYPLEVMDVQFLALPINTEILTVQVQHGVPCLWAIVNTHANPIMKQCKILTVGTGHPIEDTRTWKYISTYQLNNGTLVFHVFEDTHE